MAWIAPLIPIAYDMIRQKPGAPRLDTSNVPDRSAYIDQYLKGAFDPNSRLYQLAIQQANAQVNAELARRGIMGSAGEQLRSGNLTDLANKFLENEMARRGQALQVVGQMDRGQMDMSRLRNEQGWAELGLQEQRQRDMIRNASGAIGSVYGYYDKQDELKRQADREAQAQKNFEMYIGARSPSGGTYYGSPTGPQQSYLGLDYNLGGRGY